MTMVKAALATQAVSAALTAIATAIAAMIEVSNDEDFLEGKRLTLSRGAACDR